MVSQPADTSVVSHSTVQSQPELSVAGHLSRRWQITEVWSFNGIVVSLISSGASGDLCWRYTYTQRIQQPPCFKAGVVWLESGLLSCVMLSGGGHCHVWCGTIAVNGVMEGAGEALAAGGCSSPQPCSPFPSALFSLQQTGSVSEESDPALAGAAGQESPEKASVPAPILLQVLLALSVKPTPACVCKGCCELHKSWQLLGPRCLPRAGQETCKQAGVRKFTCASNQGSCHSY